MALGRYNIGSLSHRPDGSRAVSPSLPTGGSSSLDLRSPDPTPGTQKWDPDQTWDPMPLPLTLNLNPSFPACHSHTHTWRTRAMPQGRNFCLFQNWNRCQCRYSLNGGIKTVPVPYLPADTARSVSSTSEYGQATSRTPSRSVHAS